MEGYYKPTKADLVKVAKALGDGFYDYPIHAWLLPDDAFRKQKHPQIAMVYANYGYRFGNLVATSDKCEGVMLYAPVNGKDATTIQLLRCGMLQIFLTSWGRKWIDQFDKASKANDKIRQKNASFPHIYIWVAAVLPEHQGKGFAHKLLDPLLKKADEENTPVYLETYKPKNVDIYNRFGFELLEKYPVPETPLTLHSMLRNPRKN